MAMKLAATSAIRSFASSSGISGSSAFARCLHASAGSKKIVGVFYKANEYAAKNPNFLGCAERALGIREWLESQGHQYIVTDDKEGPNCELEKHIPDLHVLISTPFHPAYVTEERIKRAKNLQLLLTAGIGSDHIDLKAAAAAGLTVAEVTGSNVVSVAEDELMRILILMDPELENQTGAKFEEDLDAMLPKCDIVVINTPLTEKTRGLFNKDKIAKMKKGVLIVNNARGAIMDTQAVVDACSSGQIGGYSGDVWYPQPAPKDHPWRYMPNQAMTPYFWNHH
ncbi:hypothetical protein GH714_010547 [Hevea brasiliensis]|uniref:D-isomer specific 2-hydroxyacid dehydrogenase NAD-binding domain-containing protein n=1 Tax=Hevea brasiliensis TaxID=3981 RepID=A0A6A6M805_HEVBR|nr:hypothetical protein GH714_010547 [Hevea brasiliensis]